MRAIFHYACSQSLSAKLKALTPTWLDVRSCPESDAALLYRLLSDAEVLLHVPLAAETERLIDGAALLSMKPGALLINTARGGLVDQRALIAALRSGRLLGAGLDVYDQEPVPADCPLLEMDNVVLQPHVAWLTPETLGRSLAVAMENCRRLRDGEELLHRVL